MQRNLISFERSRKFFPETTHPRREGRSRQGVETELLWERWKGYSGKEHEVNLGKKTRSGHVDIAIGLKNLTLLQVNRRY